MTARPLALLLLFVAGCTASHADEPASQPTSLPATGDPAAALDAMDGRRPVPLLPMMAHHQKQNMRDHLVVVQEISTAMATDDFAAVEKAAKRIGYSDQMAQMCNHMGMGAPGFSEQALAFHRTADGIVAAAKKKDREGVFAALGETLAQCTSCHATYKQKVVDAATWQKLTGGSPPHH